jgi:hypothetical protein
MGRAQRLSRIASLLLVLLGMGAPKGVAAQSLSNGGFDLRLFRHAVDSKGLASVNGTDVLGHKSYSFGLIVDGAFNLVPYRGYKDDTTARAEDARRTDFLVDHYFTAVLHANFGLFNRLVLGAQLPVAIINGPNVEAPGQYNESASGGLGYQGIGNLVLHAKYRILRMETAPIGLAAILQVGLPTGNSDQFSSEPGAAIWPSVALGYKPHRILRLNGEVGYRYVTGNGATVNFNRRTNPLGTLNSTVPDATRAGVVSEGTPITYDSHLTFGGGAALRVSPAVDLIAEEGAVLLRIGR